jgi:hypothetical protein
MERVGVCKQTIANFQPQFIIKQEVWNFPALLESKMI